MTTPPPATHRDALTPYPATGAHALTTSRALSSAARVTLLALIPVLGLAYVPSRIAGLDAARMPKELVLVSLGACALLYMATSDRQSLSFGEWLLVASCGVAAISVTRAINPYVAFRATTITVSAIVVGLALRRTDPRTRYMALVLFVGTGTAVAAIALAELVRMLPAMSLPSRGPGGVFLHRNAAAHFVTLGIPASWWVVHTARRRGTRGLAVAAAAVMIAFIVVSRCRGAWVAVIVSVPVVIGAGFWRKNGTRPVRALSTSIWTLSLGTGIILAIPLTRMAGYTERTPLASTAARLLDVRSGSGHGRVLEMRHSIRMWQNAPLLGVGPGNWSVEYPRYAPADDPSLLEGLLSVDSQPHSDYVGILAERGVVGSAIIAGALLLLLVRLRDCERETVDAVTVSSTLLAALLMGVVDPIVLTAAGLGAVTLVVASLVPVSGRAPHQRAIDVRLLGERVSSIAASVWLAVALVFLSRSVLATVYDSQARGIQVVVQATRVAPWDYRAQMLRALALIATDRCSEARGPLERAHTLEPNWPAPDDLGAECAPPIVVSTPRSDSTR